MKVNKELKRNPLMLLKGILRRPLTFSRALLGGLLATTALLMWIAIFAFLVFGIQKVLNLIPPQYKFTLYVFGFIFFIFIIFVINLSQDHIARKIRNFLLDIEDDAVSLPTGKAEVHPIIDAERINELRAIKNSRFDLKRLIGLCDELNNSYSSGSYMAVAMLIRSLLDHVPPIFGFSNFKQLANNHGSLSFKKSMQHLDNSSRNIADRHLHTHIRSKEAMPNKTQVNFSNDLDVLLEEIVRILQ